jgi:hypothetical protein
MPLLCSVLAIHRFDREPHVRGRNVGSAEIANTPMTIRASVRVACALQIWRIWTVCSQICQRALGLQKNRSRLITQVQMAEQPTHQSSLCLCRNRQSGRCSGRSDRHSQDVEYFRGFDGATGSTDHST